MQISTKQLVDTTRNTILESVTNDTQAVISLLRKNGIQVPDDAQPTQVFIILIKAIKDSATVRKDYTNYLKSYVDSFKNYVESYKNTVETPAATTTKKSYQDTFFGVVFPPEKLGQYLDTGINLYTTNLANQSQRQSEENALKLEQAKANTYYAQGMANVGTGGGTGAGAGAGAGGGKGKTLTYVLVGLLVVGAGVGAYFYFRKK
jgi:hypothetical protein